MRVTVHQPEFMPWLGFFHKASLADVVVLLDDAQFRKNYFHNRNRVRTREGWSWITVPVERSPLDTPLSGMRIAEENNPRWRDKAENALKMAYGRAPHFAEVFEPVVDIFNEAGPLLGNLNVRILEWMLRGFRLAPTLLRSSEMGISTKASQRILDICIAANATTYVSGISGADYLDVPSFERSGIAVVFQEFHHPIYTQLFPGFEPQMSAIEALFLFGSSGRDLLEQSWPSKMERVFT